MSKHRISRTDARAQGLSRYFTGKPCKRGHVAERKLASGTCMECGKIADEKRRAKPDNKARLKEWWSTTKTRHKERRATPEHRTRQNKWSAARRAKPESKAWYRDWRALQRATNIQYRLSKGLRSRLNMAIKGGVRGGSAVRDLGCTILEFKTYIEAQFQPDMTWENWTMDGWHLDHKVPLAVFDLTDRVQFLKASHYSNYQPLWAEHNLQKGNRLNWESRGEQEDFLGSTR